MMTAHKIWLKRVALLTFLFLLAPATFNFIVDPFGLYNFLKIDDFNSRKKEFSPHMRMAKAHSIQRIKPKGIILGTSRADYGMATDHEGWDHDARPRYNLGLRGANIYEILSYMKFAQSVVPLKQVVIGLDFFSFNVFLKNGDGFVEKRLKEKTYLFREKLSTLFSLDSLKSSLDTVYAQNDGMLDLHLVNGQGDPVYMIQRTISLGGDKKVFRVINGVFWKNNYKKFAFSEPKSQSTMQYYREIIAFAYDNNIDLHLFISPLHASMLELAKLSNLWADFEEWKRTLVFIAEKEATKRLKTPFPVWDFANYNKINSEVIPQVTEKTAKMKFYFDPSHYREEVGNMVYDKIFSIQTPGRNIPKGFGVLLDRGNIEKHLMQIRRLQNEYYELHKEEYPFMYR